MGNGNQRTHTSRGFRIFAERIPAGECTLRVQESSLFGAGPHCWMFVDDMNGAPLASDVPSPQIDVPAAKRLIAALQAFVTEAEAGKLTEPPLGKEPPS